MAAVEAKSPSHPLTPLRYRVVGRRRDVSDVVTLALEPVLGEAMAFVPGQFNMLTAFGVGEAAISISSAPWERAIEHTVRDVGPVSHALCEARQGDVIGVRGPFGTGWPVGELLARSDEDVVVVTGGIGLAPLRGAVVELAAALSGARTGRVVLLVGARSPDQLLYSDDLARWGRQGVVVGEIVDVGDRSWGGPVGVVTTLVAAAEIDASRTTALVCGPEVMIRFTARALLEKGIAPERIFVSLERNMQCGIGWCGHCQLGPLLLCRHGPVVPYTSVVAHLLSERER